MRRVLGATADPLCRARLLPAQIEIALAAGDIEGADRACSEFEQVAAVIGRGVPEAIAAQACGAVLLAQGRGSATRLAFPLASRPRTACLLTAADHSSYRLI